MTKQKEIREGIANRLVWWKDAICRMVEDDKNPNAESPMTITKFIIQDLVDAGAVIKVDRELPKITPEKDALLRVVEYRKGVWAGYNLCTSDMLEARYVAVVPLIKEIDIGSP